MVKEVGSNGHSKRDRQDGSTSADANNGCQDDSSSIEQHQNVGEIGSRDELEKPGPLGLKLEISESLIDEVIQTLRRGKHEARGVTPKNMIDPPDDLEKSSPLGLTLEKSPSSINQIAQPSRQDSTLEREQPQIGDSKKRQKVGDESPIAHGVRPKKVASCAGNLLEIGSWKRLPTNGGDLVFKIDFDSKNLVWEILEDGLNNKIEFPLSSITAIRAIFSDDQPSVVDVELEKPPMFFRDFQPDLERPRLWLDVCDFTGGEASIHRRHHLEFEDRDGSIKKRCEELLGDHPHLSILSQKPFPSSSPPFF